MPEFDEDVLRDLMVTSTDDLHAPPSVTAGILARHRRRRTRTTVLSVTATGAAAALIAGVLVTAPGSHAAPSTTVPAHVQLTAAQRSLFALSKAAAATPQQHGRYVVLRDKQSQAGAGAASQSSLDINVIDSVTGGGWTYQDWKNAPHQLSDSSGTTQAQYDAMPTATAPLRAALLAQAKQQLRQAYAWMLKQQQKLPRQLRDKKSMVAPNTGETSDDLVFSQAMIMLWSPLLSPALRSGLYKVLAATPGVVVKTGVKDSIGRPAIEISRLDTNSHVDEQVFEDPATGATLQAVNVTQADQAQHIEYAYGSDLYLSITRTNKIPPNPYQH